MINQKKFSFHLCPSVFICGYIFVCFFCVLLVFSFIGSPSYSEDFLKDIEKEMEYVDALVTRGIKDGDMPSLEKAHRTLANLGVTIESVPQPAARVAFQLAISYFYVRMAQPVIFLQITKTTNPTNFHIDPIRESEHYFHEALRTAREASATTIPGDAYFLVGIGYDALRASLADFHGIKLSELHEMAKAHIRKAISLGTAIPDPSATLQKLLGIAPEKHDTAISTPTFLELHTALYLRASLPQTISETQISTPTESAPPKEEIKPAETKEEVKPAETKEETKPAEPKEEVKPVETKEETKPNEPKEGVKPEETKEEVKPIETKKEITTEKAEETLPKANESEVKAVKKEGKNIYIDYKWRFSVAPVDESWGFYPEEVSKTRTKLTVQRTEDKPKAGSGVQIAARILSPAEAALSIEELVKKSLQVLISAGYKIGTEGKINFKGSPAYEAVLTHTSSAIGTAASFSSKQYILIVVSSDIQYIVSFSTMEKDYDALYPDLKEIVNSFAVF